MFFKAPKGSKYLLIRFLAHRTFLSLIVPIDIIIVYAMSYSQVSHGFLSFVGHFFRLTGEKMTYKSMEIPLYVKKLLQCCKHKTRSHVFSAWARVMYGTFLLLEVFFRPGGAKKNLQKQETRDLCTSCVTGPKDRVSRAELARTPGSRAAFRGLAWRAVRAGRRLPRSRRRPS